MISLHHIDPEFQHDYPSPEHLQALHDKFAKAIAHNYAAAKNLLWSNAIKLANGGELPSDEEIRERATEIVTKDGVSHLLWDHPKIKLGDSVDMSYEIASIDPPLGEKP